MESWLLYFFPSNHLRLVSVRFWSLINCAWNFNTTVLFRFFYHSVRSISGASIISILRKLEYYGKQKSLSVLHLGEHGVVVRALSTHHCWSLSKSFIPSLVVWSVTQNNACDGEKQNKKSNGEQSDLRDLEQVTLKQQLQAHHCLTTRLQTWYHSLLWGDSIRKGADLKKQNCLFGVHPAVMRKLTSLSFSLSFACFDTSFSSLRRLC